MDVLRGYVRDAELFKDHAGEGLRALQSGQRSFIETPVISQYKIRIVAVGANMNIFLDCPGDLHHRVGVANTTIKDHLCIRDSNGSLKIHDAGLIPIGLLVAGSK